MKRILFLIFFLSFFNLQSANAEQNCPGVNFPADYNACCINPVDYATNKNKCDAYLADNPPQCGRVTNASENSTCCSSNSAYLNNKSNCDQYAKENALCPNIGTDNQYQSCCTGVGYTANKERCDQYSKQQSIVNSSLQTTCTNLKFDSLLSVITFGECFLKDLIPIILLGIVLFLLVSIFRYISEKDSKKQADYRKVIVWGIVGLFVAVSVWGLVNIVSNILGLGIGNPIPFLQVKP